MENLEIIEYKPELRQAFKSLNEEWIEKYFSIEESDLKALDDPEGYILDKGGVIIFALSGSEPLGTCALIKMDGNPFDFELAKMAVSPKARGKGLGFKLGTAIIEKARQLGASSIYLESNTKLAPALSLYRKLGFQEISDYPSPYSRCNVQMELKL